MKRLVIYPSFLCPFSCNFCITKNKNSLNEVLSINVLKNFMNQNHNNVSEIIISGGEPMSLNKTYFNELIDTLKQYNKKITIFSYPLSLENYRDDVEYNLSYDFMAKPRAMEVWENLLKFKKKFDLTITISPLIFKYHPNNLLQKLSLIPNVKNVEFIPYYKNDCSEYDITKNDCLTKFNKILLQSKLNIPFKLINKEKIRQQMLEKTLTPIDVHMFPTGELFYQSFNDNGILKFVPTNTSIFNQEIYFNQPEEIDLYSDSMTQWCKHNGL